MKPVPHYVKSLAMAVPAVLVGLQISAWIGFLLSRDQQQRADFRAYYYAGEILRSGQAYNLYQHYNPADVTSAFIHPAYETLIFAPLTLLPMRAAHAIWIVLNCAVAFLVCRTARPEITHLSKLFPWLPLAILASYLPVDEALMQGQDSLLLALLICIAFLRLRQGKFFEAGVWLGFGVFRFQFLAVLVLLFLLWRGWRVLSGFCTSAVCMFLVSILVAGLGAQREYIGLLQRLANPTQQPVIGMVNLRALLTALGVKSAAPLVIASLAVMLVVRWFGRAAGWSQKLLLGVAAACLLSYHAFLHDLSLLVVPMLVTCDTALESRQYLHLGVLALVLAFPTFLALAGLPLWVNSLGSIAELMVLLQQRNDAMPTALGVAAEVRG